MPSYLIKGCAWRATLPLWPSSCKCNVRERSCRVNCRHIGFGLSRNSAAKKPSERPLLALGHGPRDQLTTAGIASTKKEKCMSYSSNGNRPKLSEKGLLTPDNCVVALIDHQGQMLFGTSNFDRQGIINNTVAFGKAARVFDVPVVLTTVETKSFSGNMWPQLRAVFPGQEPIERSSMNS